MDCNKNEGAQVKELGEKNFSVANPLPRPPRPPPRHNTFWTICILCEMYYEFERSYLHQTIRCPECREPFLAMEVEVPSQSLGGGRTAVGATKPEKFAVWSKSRLRQMLMAKARMEILEKLNDCRAAASSQKEVGDKRSTPTKKRQVNVADSAGNSTGTLHQMVSEIGDCGQKNSSQQKGRLGGGKTAVRGSKPENVPSWSKSKTRHTLMAKARVEILKKVGECRAAASSVSSQKEVGDN